MTLSVDFDRLAEHLRWLAENGCSGATPNGSLGEYQTLTPQERGKVVSVALEAAPAGFSVIPALPPTAPWRRATGSRPAAQAGAPAVMLLPPNAYRCDERAVLHHYSEAAKVGLP